MSETEHNGHEAPADLADELAAKAAQESDPGVRAYLLEWANLFRRLANLGADIRPTDRSGHDDRPDDRPN